MQAEFCAQQTEHGAWGFKLLRRGLTERSRVVVSSAFETAVQRGEACVWLVKVRRLVAAPGNVRLPALIPQRVGF